MDTISQPPKHRKVLWYFAKAPNISAKLSVIKFFFKRILKDIGLPVRTDDELTVNIGELTISFIPFWGELIHYQEIFIDKVYEQHPSFLPAECKIIFDCGANIGLYTMHAAHNHDTKIYAFEPNPSVYERLKKNIEINGLSNVSAYQQAIGAVRGKSKLYWDSSTLSGKVSEKDSTGTNFAEIEITTLDHVCSELKVPFIDLLKLDVEGKEYEALKGGRQTLKTTKRLVMEYHNDKVRKECESFLKDIGFNKIIEIPGHQYYVNSNIGV